MNKKASQQEIDEVVDQAQIVRDMFGQMISEACRKLADKLHDDPDISVAAFMLGVEWGTMTFAAVCARFHHESEQSFVGLARDTLKEETPEGFFVSTMRQPKAH